MWISHFTVPLFFRALLSNLYPSSRPVLESIPSSFLSLSGFLPDVLFLILTITSTFEHYVFRPFKYLGCFRYDAYYPYSHSLLGESILGVIYGLVCTELLNLPMNLAAMGLFLLGVTSHWFLDVPVHRGDMSLTPHSGPVKRFSYGVFDNPNAIFWGDLIISAVSLLVHYRTHNSNPPSIEARNRNRKRHLLLLAILTLLELDFTNGLTLRLIPRRYYKDTITHSAIYLAEIIGTSVILGRLVDGPEKSTTPIFKVLSGRTVPVGRIAEKTKERIDAVAQKVRESVLGNESLSEKKGTTLIGSGVASILDSLQQVRNSLGQESNSGGSGETEPQQENKGRKGQNEHPEPGLTGGETPAEEQGKPGLRKEDVESRKIEGRAERMDENAKERSYVGMRSERFPGGLELNHGNSGQRNDMSGPGMYYI